MYPAKVVEEIRMTTRQNAQPVEVREGVIMLKCSIPPESITVWEVEDVNGVMDQVK